MSNFLLNQTIGVIPAMLTPFAENEDLDLNRTRALARYLAQKRIGGLYLTGSTGEMLLTTPDERKAVVETVLEEVNGRVPVIVHVGAISTRISEDLARHAEKAGADAISSVPPIYWKFNDEEILRYYQDTTEACGLPMVVYNIALAGLVSFEMILRLGGLPNVHGIKFTATTHFDMLRIREHFGPDFMIYSGVDEMAISGLSFGANGLIGSLYNVMPEPFIKLYQQTVEGDFNGARKTQSDANRIIMVLLKHNLIPAMKYISTFNGVDAGYCRRPFARLNEAEGAALRKDLIAVRDEIGDCDLPFMKVIDK